MKHRQAESAVVYAIIKDVIDLTEDRTIKLTFPITFVDGFGYRFHSHHVLPSYMLMGEYIKACRAAAAAFAGLEFDSSNLWFTYNPQ